MTPHPAPYIPVDYLHLVPHLIDTLVLTFRMLAGVIAVMAILLWSKHRAIAEDPPYNRRLNDLAWNWAYSGFFLGASAFIALDFNYRSVSGSALGDLFVMFVWLCFAIAASCRLASRVHRPRFIYFGATIFAVVMPIYALVTGG